MQMGPAFLPTPLSPARGHLVLHVRSADRSSLLLKARLAPDVSCRSRISLAPLESFTRRSAPKGIFAIGFLTGARTGIRLPPAGLPPSRSGPKPFARCVRPFSVAGTVHPLRTVIFVCAQSYPFASIRSRTRFAVLHEDTFRVFLKRTDLLCAEAFSRSFLGPRADRCQRNLWVMNLQSFSALRRCLLSGSCPEDKLKLRSKQQFDKGCKCELSTLAWIACGWGWTTQPFVAFVVASARLERFSTDRPAKSANYAFMKIARQCCVVTGGWRDSESSTQTDTNHPPSRSRCASRRSLSAFSLIKPAASC